MHIKKTVSIFLVLICIILATVLHYADSESIKVDIENSTVSINLYGAINYNDYKVVIRKEPERYIYNVFSQEETLPLQMGQGKYIVVLYRRSSEKTFRRMLEKSFILETDENKVYLASIQNIRWDNHSTTTQLANQLTQDVKLDEKRLEAIHQYIIENIAYDHEKAESMGYRYNPIAESTLTNGTGICYDYASLTSAMLRSVGIPTKLIKGYSNGTTGYHSWNEVLINGEWIIIDTTFDAYYFQRGNISLELTKNSDDYFKSKEY